MSLRSSKHALPKAYRLRSSYISNRLMAELICLLGMYEKFRGMKKEKEKQKKKKKKVEKVKCHTNGPSALIDTIERQTLNS